MSPKTVPLPPLKPSKNSRRLYNALMVHESVGAVSPESCINVTERLSKENKNMDVVKCLVELIEEGWVKPTPDGGVYVIS